MKILVVGLNYRPESTSIGPYTADVCEYLAARGHSVDVVTGFPMAPHWRILDEFKGRIFHEQRLDGVMVHRCYLYIPTDPTKTIFRILFDCSFAISSLLMASTIYSVDCIVSVSPPLQLGVVSAILRLSKGAPSLLHIQDIVPDAAVATGAIRKSGFAVRVARLMERYAYAKADLVSVISSGFAENLKAKGVPTSKIRILPNWVDTQWVAPRPRENAFRSSLGIGPETQVVMYSGSLGAKQGLETILGAADRLRGHSRILFVIVGDGPQASSLRAQAVRDELENVRFLPLQPRERLPEQLAAADVLALTQRRSFIDAVLPGKLGYYLSAGRPVVAAVHSSSETARVLTAAGAGRVAPPEDPEGLAEAIRGVVDFPDVASAMGRAGRAYAERHLDRGVAVARFADEVEALAARRWRRRNTLDE